MGCVCLVVEWRSLVGVICIHDWCNFIQSKNITIEGGDFHVLLRFFADERIDE